MFSKSFNADIAITLLTVILLWRIVVRLLFSYGGVVVDEDEGAVVFRIDVSLCALIARTEVTLQRTLVDVVFPILHILLLLTDGSYEGSSFLLGSSCCPCHGLFVLCGETKTHEFLSGFQRRWEMSSRMASGMLLLRERGGVGRMEAALVEAGTRWSGRSWDEAECI